MNVREKVLQRAKLYIGNKDYDLKRVQEGKIKKAKVSAVPKEALYEFEVGDKVKVSELDDYAIVYKKKDSYNNVVVLFEDTFMEVHANRLELEIKAVDLYPEGYDLSSLFVSYKERKLNRDLERGSKKALKNVAADIRKKLGE